MTPTKVNVTGIWTHQLASADQVSPGDTRSPLAYADEWTAIDY